VRNAVDELRVRAGREIPMGLTPASDNRRAFTILEPIGVVAAISARSRWAIRCWPQPRSVR
jgi:hypothetical protein